MEICHYFSAMTIAPRIAARPVSSESKAGLRTTICYDACCLAMFTAVGFSLATAKAVTSPTLIQSQVRFNCKETERDGCSALF